MSFGNLWKKRLSRVNFGHNSVLMIQFYLHGGYIRIDTEKNRTLFREVLKQCPKVHPKVLIVPFARSFEKWDELFCQVSDQFARQSEIKQCSCVCASYEHIWEEIEQADIICIIGWNTERLQSKMSILNNLRELLNNKIVIGSSAGALMFASYYYENDTNEYFQGLWILPVGMICHWENQENELAHIKKYWWVNEILCIPEWDFIIREC